MGTSRGRAVVVGADASDSARQAVGWPAELASDTGRPLRLVHVAAPTPPGRRHGPGRGCASWSTPPSGRAPTPSRRSWSRAALLNVPLERSGPQRFLVVGSYGEGVHAGMLAGTLALALLVRADCAVAVVRAPAPWTAATPTGRSPLGSGATTRHPPTPSWSWLRRSPPRTALTCSPWTNGAASSSPWAANSERVPRSASHGSELAADAAVALEARVARCRERRPGVVIESRVVGAIALRALLDQAAGARAVVVGRWRGPETGGMLGSTSRGLGGVRALPGRGGLRGYFETRVACLHALGVVRCPLSEQQHDRAQRHPHRAEQPAGDDVGGPVHPEVHPARTRRGDRDGGRGDDRGAPPPARRACGEHAVRAPRTPRWRPPCAPTAARSRPLGD